MALILSGCQPSSVARSIAHEMVFPSVSRRTARQASPMVVSVSVAHARARPWRRWAMQQTVHQQHEVEMPRLALAAAQLTVAQAQMLLAVPMQGFRPCPALPVAAQHPGYFPVGLISDQNLDRLFAVPLIPENHDPHGLRVLRQPDFLGEVPLRAFAPGHLLAVPSAESARPSPPHSARPRQPRPCD